MQKTIICFFCGVAEPLIATRAVLINIIIFSFLIIHWIVWTTVWTSFPLTTDMKTVGFVFKWLGFGIQFSQFLSAMVILIKYWDSFLEKRRFMRGYAIFTFYISLLQLLLLMVPLCLTAIVLENASAGDGISSLSRFFRVSRFVILACIVIAIWQMHMSFGLWKVYDDKVEISRKEYDTIQSNKVIEIHQANVAN